MHGTLTAFVTAPVLQLNFDQAEAQVEPLRRSVCVQVPDQVSCKSDPAFEMGDVVAWD